MDIFVGLRSEPGSLLVSPQSIFDYLKARGCTMEDEYIVMAGWPVQFLRPTGPLVEEAFHKLSAMPSGHDWPNLLARLTASDVKHSITP